MIVFIGILILAFFNGASCAGERPVDEAVLRTLEGSPTAAIFERELAKDIIFNTVFHFLTAVVGVTIGSGGRLVSATAATFPALVKTGVSMNYAYVEPCGLVAPHIHPRAASMIIACNGTFLTGYWVENSTAPVINTLQPGDATVFPQGSVHFEFNMGCEPAVFIAARSSEDPGSYTATGFISRFPPAIVAATLGYPEGGLESFIKGLPDFPSKNVKECLLKCKKAT
ncbi:unnamed protein product [Rotaria sordida]|uniref:Cupin type-1 domain-containing protein n=1 Tax=Rotaria sordida TaxID=392033 RepID=A0A819EFT3_9BILA|nr:unnamed protein product [Rotaria sordida]CAF3850236.1 unnamed protein product [Rotaria sordida]